MATKRMNLLIVFTIVGLLLIGSAVSMGSGKEIQNCVYTKEDTTEIQDTNSTNNKIKNIIVMVPDGCSQSVQTVARWYSGEELQLDDMVSGTVSTYMSDSLITDSASAATAFSTGHKTSDGALSVGPNPATLLSTIDPTTVAEPYVPLATVLEGAKLKGKATGLVATCEIPHATPAAFASHVESRKQYDNITEQMVYQNIDVVFAGGKDFLNDSRKDGENLTKVLMDRRYQFVETEDDMMSLKSGKVWGMFAGVAMSPEIDREYTSSDEPHIANMTKKAIELLSEDTDGFFLMVEGSQVDWAGHTNDPIYMVTDFLAFDQAVEVVVDFAKKDRNTLVIVFPDHNTGGMTLGSSNDESYTKTTVEDLVDPLKNMQCTYSYLESQIQDMTNSSEIHEEVLNWMGINLTATEINEVVTSGNFETLKNTINNNYTIIGWTTGGHCGEDVPLWTYGPGSLSGRVDNTEIATYISKELNFSLDNISEKLFVDVDEAFPGKYELDKTDSNNLVLKIGDYKLPVNKDILIDSKGVEHKLDGIVIYAPKANDGKGKVYIPQQAVDMIKI
ncbi:alkaline phosphatase [uncultured Methanomethylovorans sp.]|uniref:alkaline phosphatase n=1 Tax=uncultured Methanomethylovorans sp. TaxID=183759 RepID=UPI002AA7E53B|nr:alkaline phosphatase [uncultured Methanomethylovorans sp.]